MRQGRAGEKLLTAKIILSTNTAVFNLPKENMWFQDTIRDHCFYSKHIMNTNCWLSFNRMLNWEANSTLIFQKATQ